MKARHPGWGAWAVPAVLAALAVACEPVSGPRTGSQTNWMRACRVDADCGGLECLCGACTRTCEAGSECAELPAADCVPADDAGAVALCGGHRPVSPGLCLARCDDVACPTGTACVADVCASVPEPSVRVTVDTSSRFQTLVGFGASVAYVNDEIVQHPRKAELFEAMFAGTGADVLRLRNRHGNPGEEDLGSTRELVDAATASLGRQPLLMLTSASPPAALKANGSTSCQGDPDTCTLVRLADGGFDYGAFADHWRASLDAYAVAGIEPDYIGLQNNPNWVPPASESYEACRFLPTEGTATVTVDGAAVEVTYPGFAEALAAVVARLPGLASVPRIAAPEVTAVDQVVDYAPYLDFTAVDAIAHHMYGTDPAAIDLALLAELRDLGQQYQRPLWQTEMQSDGLGTAILLHHSLVVEGVAAYLQNDFVSSAAALEPNLKALVSLTEEDFTFETPYHVIRHYALHTDPGWVRVAATVDSGGLLASAWLSPAEDALTMVLVNGGTAEIVPELDLGAVSPVNATVTRTTLDGLERSAALGDLAAERVIRVPAHSVVTVTMSL